MTAHVGLDTLCQLIEPYISNAANPIVDALAKEGIVRAARSLRYYSLTSSQRIIRIPYGSIMMYICLFDCTWSTAVVLDPIRKPRNSLMTPKDKLLDNLCIPYVSVFRIILMSFRAVVANGNDLTAREDLAIASVLGEFEKSHTINPSNFRTHIPSSCISPHMHFFYPVNFVTLQ